MPFVTKASRRVKQPAHQRGTRPPTKELRDAQAITANHEAKFARSFNKLLRDLLTDDMVKIIRAAIREGGTVEDILDKIPFFDPDNVKTFAIWQGFAAKLEQTYAEVIDETIENENRKRGWKIETLKIEAPEMPVNPTAEQFVRAQALLRVVDISLREKRRLRSILTANMDEGFVISRPEALIDEIRDTVGLTAFQQGRVAKQAAAARAAGMSVAGVRKLTQRVSSVVRLQRARTIARTETNDALSQGLTESWKRAADAGLVPPGTLKQWVAMPFEEGRSSDECQDLDNHEPIPLNANFSTSEGDGFTGPGPPAHPNCRSTLTMVFPK